MIDSHCHLTDTKFNKDRNTVIERAQKVGVSTIITIADTLEEAEQGITLCKKYDDFFCTAGVHPHNAKDWKDMDIQKLKKLCENEKVVAIGEIGLDHHYDFSPRKKQQEVFHIQLQLAKELKLPAIVHSRKAIEDTWKIIQQIQPEKIVLHCCMEKWSDVARFIDAGYILSFTGIATYPQSDTIRETIRHCPLSQMMVETDAPYLTPVPCRGKRNEPAYVMEVARCIAEAKGVSVEEVDRVTTENTREFFGIKT